MIKNILFVGVGGQGIILASKILAEGLSSFGYDVKMSEVHGMAQRGGSVTTQVRFGDKIYSPLIGKGEADVIVAFEKLEAARWISYLRDGGSVVVNDYEIHPMTVQIGREVYPGDITLRLQEKIENLKILKAADIASSLGNIKAQNIVMLGALVKALGLHNLDWESIIRESLPEKLHQLNFAAIREGINA